MQVISRSSSQFSYLTMFPGEGSLITRLYYLVSAQRVQTAASGYSSWLGSLSEVRNTAVGFKWKTHHQIRFPETGEMLKAAGLKGMASDGSTAGQHVLSLRSSTLLCLVSSQQCFNGVKWTERKGKLFLLLSWGVYECVSLWNSATRESLWPDEFFILIWPVCVAHTSHVLLKACVAAVKPREGLKKQNTAWCKPDI